ncbi:hypothetical protein JGG76_24175 [Salmonella enterica subsp. enterica serovar Derby]|nr:hypothetical protein [Salmonella enterica subsp. enterica serovar Derby]
MHKQHIPGRAAIAKPLVSQVNMKWRLQWCQEHATWSVEQWKHVLFSNESTFTLFPTTERVHVWNPRRNLQLRMYPSSSEAWVCFHCFQNGLGHVLVVCSRSHYHLTRTDQWRLLCHYFGRPYAFHGADIVSVWGLHLSR